jgi:co-chaperonin GroES (HSP10)
MMSMSEALEPHDWSVQGRIIPLKDRILVHQMEYGETRTKAGIIVTSDDGKERGIRPRWASVYSVGPEVTEVKPGDRVLVAHGRWSRGVSVADDMGNVTVVRMVENESIMLVEDAAS